jgi:hypothetical protein
MDKLAGIPDGIAHLSDVTRVVIVDHTKEVGPFVIMEEWNLKEVIVSIQDNGRTLKVWVK